MMDNSRGSIYHTPVLVDEVLAFVNERKKSTVMGARWATAGIQKQS